MSFVHVWFVFFIAAVLSPSLFLFKVLSHLNFSPHKRFFSGSSRTSLCKGGECVQREPVKSFWGVFVHTFTPIKGTSKHVQIARRQQCSNFFFLLLLLSFFFVLTVVLFAVSIPSESGLIFLFSVEVGSSEGSFVFYKNVIDICVLHIRFFSLSLSLFCFCRNLSFRFPRR